MASIKVIDPVSVPLCVLAELQQLRAELAQLNANFWWLIGFATVLTLARFSEAFLLLAAEHVARSPLENNPKLIPLPAAPSHRSPRRSSDI